MRVSPTSSSLCTFKLVSESIVGKSLSRVQLFVTSWTAAHQAPCSSLSPRVGSNSCPLSWWYHPTILSSVTPFSSCPQSFPASGSFLMSWLFTSGGQSIGTSASVLPMHIQDRFLLGLTSLISLQSKGFSSLSLLSLQGTSIFWFYGCSHSL